jgi:CubicO group peptidase (beta-lactamase class C family)
MQHVARLVVLLPLFIDNTTQAETPQPDRENAPSQEFYFPPSGIEWDRVTPSTVGWDPAGIADALEFAGTRGSSSMVILYRGRILAEQHWNLTTQARLANGRRNRYHAMRHGSNARGHNIEDVASIQKSVVAILTGIAQQKGLLKISDPVHQHLGAGWSQAKPDAESQITLRHLLTMSSGLNDRLEFVVPPEKRWRYNTAAYSQVLKCLATVFDQDANQLTRKWLTEPIGMNDSRWVDRPGQTASTSANHVGFATSAQDLARFGLLVLAQGRWNGTSVLNDREYLKAALTSSQDMNPAYGYLWWLNGQRSSIRGGRSVTGPLNSRAPRDLVAGLGALGRKLWVVPSLDLVVTRLGNNPQKSGRPQFDAEFWKLLMQAAPDRKRQPSADDRRPSK